LRSTWWLDYSTRGICCTLVLYKVLTLAESTVQLYHVPLVVVGISGKPYKSFSRVGGATRHTTGPYWKRVHFNGYRLQSWRTRDREVL